MGQISIKIANRTYRLSCGDGEESRLTELAGHVRLKAEQLTAEHGRIADDHLMLMSAILIADELWDERAKGPAASDMAGPRERAFGDRTLGDRILGERRPKQRPAGGSDAA